MNRTIATAVSLPVLLAALVACSSDDTAAQTPANPPPAGNAGASTTSALPDKGVHMPAEPKPVKDADKCPYLDTEFVMEANGQHITTVKLSDDSEHPTCFFYRPDGNWQVTVQVYAGDEKTAKAIVDRAAPVKTSNPATAPDGWNGGAMPTENGSVYAVAKGGNAVVTTSNQKQSIKPKRITVQAIEGLGF